MKSVAVFWPKAQALPSRARRLAMAFVVTMVEEGSQEGEEQSARVVEIQSAKTSLRDLQEDLCRAFKKPFPAKMAILTVDGQVHDDFQARPFAEGAPSEACTVVFKQTDDPFFYDLRDRKMVPVREELSPRPTPAFPALDGFPLLG